MLTLSDDQIIESAPEAGTKSAGQSKLKENNGVY